MKSYLVREAGGARRVHACNCPIVNNYTGHGIEEIPRFKYGKYNTCKICEAMMYVANMASDYEENFPKYKKWFAKVKPKTLARIAFHKHGKLMIAGNKLYIKVGSERFYLDMKLFDIGEVSLWHNNYNLKKRAEGSTLNDWEITGYHEHKLERRTDDAVSNALEYILYYDFDKAKDVHDKTRKQTHRPQYTESDPAYWGLEE